MRWKKWQGFFTPTDRTEVVNGTMTLSPTRRNVLLLLLALAVALIVTDFGALALGGVHLSLGEVWSGLLGGHPRSEASIIVRDIRLPRILLAMLVGAALAVSG